MTWSINIGGHQTPPGEYGSEAHKAFEEGIAEEGRKLVHALKNSGVEVTTARFGGNVVGVDLLEDA